MNADFFARFALVRVNPRQSAPKMPLAFLAVMVFSYAIELFGADLQQIPPLTARVTDTTGTLDWRRKQTLETSLTALEQRKGAQLARADGAVGQPENRAVLDPRRRCTEARPQECRRRRLADCREERSPRPHRGWPRPRRRDTRCRKRPHHSRVHHAEIPRRRFLRRHRRCDRCADEIDRRRAAAAATGRGTQGARREQCVQHDHDGAVHRNLVARDVRRTAGRAAPPASSAWPRRGRDVFGGVLALAIVCGCSAHCSACSAAPVEAAARAAAALEDSAAAALAEVVEAGAAAVAADSAAVVADFPAAAPRGAGRDEHRHGMRVIAGRGAPDVVGYLLLAGCSLFTVAAARTPIPELHARVTDLTATLMPPRSDRNPRQRTGCARVAQGRADRRADARYACAACRCAGHGRRQRDLATHVFDRWKLGRKGIDDGVLLIVVKNDRKVRIEVGYGLEGAIPDAATARIIREYITPKFREGDYYGDPRDDDVGQSHRRRAAAAPLEGSRATDSQQAPLPWFGALLAIAFASLMLDFLLQSAYSAPIRVIPISVRRIVGLLAGPSIIAGLLCWATSQGHVIHVAAFADNSAPTALACRHYRLARVAHCPGWRVEGVGRRHEVAGRARLIFDLTIGMLLSGFSGGRLSVSGSGGSGGGFSGGGGSSGGGGAPRAGHALDRAGCFASGTRCDSPRDRRGCSSRRRCCDRTNSRLQPKCARALPRRRAAASTHSNSGVLLPARCRTCDGSRRRPHRRAHPSREWQGICIVAMLYFQTLGVRRRQCSQPTHITLFPTTTAVSVFL